MFGFTSAGPITSSSLPQSRLSSPSRAHSNRNRPQHAPEASCTDLSKCILPPPAVFSPYTPYEAGLTLITEDSTYKPPHSHRRTRTEGFLDNCKLPPLFSPRPSSRSSGQGRPFSFLSAFAPQEGHRPQSSSGRSPSPRRRAALQDQRRTLPPTLTNEENGQQYCIESKRNNNLLADWFRLKSAPLRVESESLHTFEHEGDACANNNCDETMSGTSFTGDKRKGHGRPQARHTRRFSLFNALANSGADSVKFVPPDEDPLLNIDIENALFPNGAIADATSPSPAEFKDLQKNATALISDLLDAYRHASIALQEAAAEKDAAKEEREEAQLRSKHLRMQLVNLSDKLQEQEQISKDLAKELAEEKEHRRLEEDLRRRSLTPSVKEPIPEESAPTRPKASRQSYQSTCSSDSGFGSEDESPASSADSIFSRQTMATDVTTPDFPQTPRSFDAEFSSSDAQQQQQQHGSKRQSAPPKRMSAIGRIFHGMADLANNRPPVCQNCHGIPSCEAWSIVGILKEENHGLKQQVDQLNDAVENCLDVVNGLHL